MSIEKYQNIASKLSHLIDDIKAEVIAAEIIKNKRIDIRQIKIKSLGLFRRDYRKLIEEVGVASKTVKTVKDEKLTVFKYLFFSIWKEGIYDSLPKGVFHDLRKEKKAKTLGQIKKDVKKQNGERQVARDFFSPIEQEFFRHRIYLEQEERKILEIFSSKSSQRFVLEDFWERDLENIPISQLSALLHFLPMAFHFKGDLRKTESIMSTILRQDIELIKSWGHRKLINDSLLPFLSEIILGVNSVLGNTYAEGIPDLLIRINNLKVQQIEGFLPNKTQVNVCQILADFLLPIEVSWKLDINLQLKDRSFDINKKPYSGRLGYSTYL